jgi:hypothetical protein
MARSFGLLTLAASVALSAPAAAQPISQSMAECAALYSVAGDHVGTLSTAERLYEISEGWFGLAISTARAEGRRAPEAHVGSAYTAKCEEWSDRGRSWAFSEEFRDWTAYCRALGKRHDLDIALD